MLRHRHYTSRSFRSSRSSRSYRSYRSSRTFSTVELNVRHRVQGKCVEISNDTV